jgi:hypothetical protein
MAIAISTTTRLSYGADVGINLHTGYEGGDAVSFTINTSGGVTSARFSATIEQAREIHAAIERCLNHKSVPE